jgi:uncharacterized membrane protein HdeD (DUF308 family)
MEMTKNIRRFFIWEGIFFIILGTLAVLLPVAFTFGVGFFIGWILLLSGIIQGFRTFKTRHSPGFWPSLLSALLSIVMGILLLVYPVEGVLSLTLLLTIFFAIEGIMKIVLSFNLRPFKRWGWLFVSGLISLAMAFIIWSGWPGTALWVIGLLVGINMIFLGFSQLFIGLNAKTLPE